MKKLIQSIASFSFALLFTFMHLFAFSQASAEVIVIVHPSQTVNNASKSDIARVFLGKTKTLKGKGVTPINQVADSSSRSDFDNNFLNKTPQQIKAYWSKQLFSGGGAPPKEKANDQEIVAHVAGNKKAIGYINKSSLDDSVKAINTQ